MQPYLHRLRIKFRAKGILVQSFQCKGFSGRVSMPDLQPAWIRMLGSRDLFAMKIFAILKRGQKKDFFDVFELLMREICHR
jgi:predicted nucleotidyltransferase component of viral defense system